MKIRWEVNSRDEEVKEAILGPMITNLICLFLVSIDIVSATCIQTHCSSYLFG